MQVGENFITPPAGGLLFALYISSFSELLLFSPPLTNTANLSSSTSAATKTVFARLPPCLQLYQHTSSSTYRHISTPAAAMAQKQQPITLTAEEVQDQENHAEVMDHIGYLLEGLDGTYSFLHL